MQLKPYTKLLAESWQEFNKDLQGYLTIALMSGVGLYFGFVTDILNVKGVVSDLIMAVLYIVFVMLGLLAILSKADEKSKLLNPSESFAKAKQHFGKVFGTYLVVLLIVILGFIALIVPGIILSVMFAFVIPVALFEGKYYMDAAKQSMHYVKGYWLHVFGRFIFIALIVALPIWIIGALISPIVGDKYSIYIQDFLNLLALPLIIIFDYFLYKEFIQIKSESVNGVQQSLEHAEQTISSENNQ